AYQRARQILETSRDAVERVAMSLLEREVLDAAEVKLLIEGKTLPERPPSVPPAGAPPVPTKEPHVVRPEPRPAHGFTKGEKPAPA
ncbi:MAG: ATP-dependent zinc metalloprotease FtsH, partial [Candidatus Acidiferrales bacterium]